MATTGFVFVTSFMTERNRAPFLICSIYRMIAFVDGSVPAERAKSSIVRSAWFPTLATIENPIPSGMLQSTMVVMIAPLCEMNAMEPGRGEMGSKVVLIPRAGFISPRQFGPMTRIPFLRAAAISSSSRALPAGPVSRNPEERMIASGTCFPPASSMTCGTFGAGMAMTTALTSPGIEARSG